MLTWSLGCTSREPGSAPIICEARLAMTSLALVLVEVPEPVWKMSRTKCWSRRPSATSPAADTIASATFSSSSPREALVLAAASFIRPRARRKVLGKAQVADGEIEHCPHGGCAVQGVLGDLHGPHGIALNSNVALGIGHSNHNPGGELARLLGGAWAERAGNLCCHRRWFLATGGAWAM